MSACRIPAEYASKPQQLIQVFSTLRITSYHAAVEAPEPVALNGSELPGLSIYMHYSITCDRACDTTADTTETRGTHTNTSEHIPELSFKIKQNAITPFVQR